MEKNKIKNRILALISLGIVVIAFVLVGQRFIFNPMDHDYVRLKGYYMEDENTLDIVMMGSSEVFCDYSPGIAYRETGLTSYPFAFNINPSTIWKYELPEILSTQSPQVLVVEVNGACYNDETLTDYGATRHLIDAMPFSQNKQKIISEMSPIISDEHLTSYYLPILKYHGEVLKHDPRSTITPFLRGYNLLRGVFAHTTYVTDKYPNIKLLDVDKNKMMPLHRDAEKGLMEFLDLCKEYDIENILFVQFPHLPLSQWSKDKIERYNTVKEIVKAQGYEFLYTGDYYNDIGLVIEEDFADGEHLNANGQEKFSAWLSRFLKEKYDLKPAQLSDKQREEWENTVKYTQGFYEYWEDYIRENPNPDDRVALTETPYAIKRINQLLK